MLITQECKKYITTEQDVILTCGSKLYEFYVYNIHRLKQALKDIDECLTLAQQTVEENSLICAKILTESTLKHKGNSDDSDKDYQAIQALKVANKQWESSVMFMVSVYWTKSDILKASGFKTQAMDNYLRVLNYFKEKFPTNYEKLQLVKDTRQKIEEAESLESRNTAKLFQMSANKTQQFKKPESLTVSKSKSKQKTAKSKKKNKKSFPKSVSKFDLKE